MLRWDGKFTGLGSAFAELSSTHSNRLIPIHAKVNDVRIFGFVSIDLSSEKTLKFLFLNRKFVRWDYLYSLINQMLIKFLGTRNIQNFKYVLCIECPKPLTVFWFGLYTPENRLGQLEKFTSCLNRLHENMEMMCRLVRIERESGDLSVKEGKKSWVCSLILTLDYSWENDFGILLEPIHHFMNGKHYFTLTETSEHIHYILLITRKGFGTFRRTIFDGKLIMSTSALLLFLKFLLNAWIDNPTGRNKYFNFLKETVSVSMPAIELIKCIIRSNNIFKPGYTCSGCYQELSSSDNGKGKSFLFGV